MKTCIYNGRIVTTKEVIEGAIYLEDGKISRIERGICGADAAWDKNLDAQGGWIIPGIIDCHSDAVELDLQPRPTSLFNRTFAFPELEKRLLSSGITTMYHSICLMQGNFNEDKVRKYYRTPQGAEELAQWISSYNEDSLIDHKLHIRYEIDNSEGIDQLKRLIREEKVDQLSFMDHTPGQGQFRNLEKYRKVIAAYRECSEEEAMKLIEESMKKETMDMKEVEEIARFAGEYNIPVASHDDDTQEKVDLVSSWNVGISEFPITLEVARYAKEKNMHTVMGAPNILLGGSHSGNLSAELAINKGVVDILCSDYYPASILHSIFYMHERGHCIVDMTKLATINPARALNISHERGSLEEGKRADLLIVTEKNGVPSVRKVFTEGEMVMNIGGWHE